MADMNVFSALHGNTISARIQDGYINSETEVSLSIRTGQDTVTLFISNNDLDTLFGTINNYLESKVVNA
jgi:hypothetical protein